MAPTARIEVFRPGTFTPMSGPALSYTAGDLEAVAAGYDAERAPAPLVIGHPDADAPAWGWVDSFEYDAGAERLFANIGEIDPTFAEAVRAGRYKKVSMAFFPPDHAANPQPGTWYPKHIGFLGGAAPAVSNLKNARFSIGAAETVTFVAAFGQAEGETAGVLRSLRDFLIEKFGLEAADRALPSYRIDWLEQMGRETGPAFASTTTDPKIKEPPVADPQPDPKPAADAARAAELADREARLAARERALSHDEHVSFAETLVVEGRLLAASRDQVVELLDAMAGGEGTVKFSTADAAIDTVAALRKILAEQPKMVTFGRHASEQAGQAATANFASDGAEVDPARLELHNKALAHQRAHAGVTYIDAVKAVS